MKYGRISSMIIMHVHKAIMKMNPSVGDKNGLGKGPTRWDRDWIMTYIEQYYIEPSLIVIVHDATENFQSMTNCQTLFVLDITPMAP